MSRTWSAKRPRRRRRNVKQSRPGPRAVAAGLLLGGPPPRTTCRAVALILEFEKFISVNRIRLVDLFETVDKDKGGTIDGDELREFLKLGRAA